jgi:cytochrome c peroxidase
MRSRWHILLAMLGACLPLLLAYANSEEWSAVERRAILRFGPWPPAPARDASNRVSGRDDAILLGERLFFDRRLSGGRNMACDWCHAPQRDWSDGFQRGVGRDVVDRNTPSLWNVGTRHWLGWDGAHDSLWSQSMRPMIDPREMSSSAKQIAERIRTDGDLSCRYEKVFGTAPAFMDDEQVLVATGKALAAFQETLVSGRTPFDAFRDALQAGDAAGQAAYPDAARRGLKLFIGKGRCSVCHVGPTFSNGEFADTGVPFFVVPGRVDPGRHGGIAALRKSAFTRLGAHSDDTQGPDTTRTRHVEPQHRNFGEFAVPSLRNVARTAPYMHAGSHATLHDVVRHYSDLDEDRLHADGERILRPLRLTPRESDDLVAFLESLSDTPKPFVRRTSDSDPPCR